MSRKGFALACLLFVAGMFLPGCGSVKATSVTITASGTTVDATDAITLTAAVANDQNAGGVTWTVTGGGTLSNTSTTAATYTAPAASGTALTVTVTATSVANANESGTVTITVPAKPAITTGALVADTVGTAYSATMAASGGISPYKWTITSGTLPAGLGMNSAGVISGTPTAAGVGTTNLTFVVTDSGTATALTATVTLGLAINAAPAIAFTGAVPATATYNLAYTGSAAAGGGAGALTYTVASGALPTGLGLNAASGAITGTPTAVGAFPFSIMAADAFGDSGTQGYSITVNAATPTLTFAAIPTHTYGDAPFTVSASSASSGAVSYSVTSGPATIVGNTVTITGAGTVVLGASQVANGNYGPATGSTSFTVNPETPTLTFAAIATHTFGDAPFTVSASSASSGAVSYSVTSGPATIVGNTVTITGGGTVVLGASQVANGNYGTATGSTSFTVNPAATTLTFTAIPTHTYGDAPFVVSATSASSGAVTYSVTSGPATVTGNTVTITGVGTVVLGASQVATASYTAATASTSFTVNIGVPTLVFTTIPSHAYGDAPFTVSATSASTGAVTYSVTSGPATIAGNTVTLTGVGTVILGASQLATADYTSATASTSFMVGTAVPTLTFAAIPTHTYGDAAFMVSATSASTGAVTYSVTSGPATIVGNTVTITGAGTVVLGASQAATANYTSATASTSFTVNPATPTLSFTAIPTHIVGDAPFTVSATSASSGTVTYSVTSGPATIVGNTVTLTGAGTVVLGASQAATTNYTSATASTSFTVESTLSITTSTTLPSGSVSVLYSQPLAATGGSGTYTTWTVTAGGTQLTPLSLSLSAGGVLSGTPTTNGTATFTAQVTDSQSHTASATFTVTIYAGLTVTTTTLPATNAGASYSQQLAAAGGTGTGYSWTATSSNLSTYGLSLSTGGLITGTVSQTGTASFTANVKDSNNNTATQALTIMVYGALSLPAPDPVSLPSTGYTSVAYTGTINASGGSGNYSWQVTGLSDNLTPNPVGGVLTISGTPGATPATLTFNVKLTDTTTGNSFTQNGYTVTISTPTPVSLPTPSTTVPGSATQNQSYNGAITATGGVSPYTWSINGTTVTGGGLALSNGLSASSTGGTSLTITGTPTTLTTVNLTNVKVQDSIGSNQTNSYSIAVNSAGSNVSGQIFLNNNCGNSGTVPTITVNLLTNPGGTVVQTQTTDSNGNYTFTTIPNGNYTISPSITGPSSVFYPATQNVNVSNSTVAGQNFAVTLGYMFSGTVTYGGSNTGRIYLSLNNTNCSGNGGTGTSIAAPGAFTIRGVPPGTYNLQAWMDLAILANGSTNTSDPTGSTPSLTVSNANLTGQAITLADNNPTTVPSANPTFQVITPTDQGVVMSYKPTATTVNGNKVEAATSYDVQWSTSSTFTSPVLHNFKAIGAQGANVWILNNGISGVSGNPFSNGTPYYFEVRARNSIGPVASWTVYGGGTPTSVTPGVSTTGIEVQGSVTIPTGVTASGPLYVGFYNQNNNTIYGTRIAAPTAGANSYTIYVPSDSNLDYINFAILDQNDNGLIDAGDVTNTGDSNNNSGMAITAPLTGQNPPLPTANSTAAVTTQYYQSTSSGGSSTGYNLSLEVRGANKLPVAVTLTSGPNMINPIDISGCSTCGNPQFDYNSSIGNAVPSVGDTYNFTVTYSDGSQDTGSTVNGKVTAFASTGAIVGASDLATNLSPSATSSISVTPTFTWTYPAGASSANYAYSFYISDNNGNTIWTLPNYSSNSNGFTYAEVPTATIVWGTDPIPGDNSSPAGNLNTSTQYNWQIQIQDSLGNSAQAQTWYKP